MPRIRSVHPDICDDETLAEVTAYAERTFIRLWTHLDDKGRGIDNAKLWKGKLYPLHDDVTSDRVERDLSELAACGLLIRYEVDGKRLLCAKPETWAKYQKPQHPTPSKLPAPPEPSRSPHEASPRRGEELEVERRRVGEEGESEGESEHAPADPPPVDNPIARSIEDRCATIPQRVSRRPSLQVVKGQGAEETPAKPVVSAALTSGAHS